MIVYKASWEGIPSIKKMEAREISTLSVTLASGVVLNRQAARYRYCVAYLDAKQAVLGGCHSLVCRRKINVLEAESALKQAKLIQKYANEKFNTNHDDLIIKEYPV